MSISLPARRPNKQGTEQRPGRFELILMSMKCKGFFLHTSLCERLNGWFKRELFKNHLQVKNNIGQGQSDREGEEENC